MLARQHTCVSMAQGVSARREQQPLGTCKKCRFLTPAQTDCIRNFISKFGNWWFSKPSRWFSCPRRFQDFCAVDLFISNGRALSILYFYIYVCMDCIYLCVDSCGFCLGGSTVVFRFLCNWDLIDIYKGIFYPDKAFRIDNMACIQVIQTKDRWRNRIMRKTISLNWWHDFIFVRYLLDFRFLCKMNRFILSDGNILYVWSCNYTLYWRAREWKHSKVHTKDRFSQLDHWLPTNQAWGLFLIILSFLGF